MSMESVPPAAVEDTASGDQSLAGGDPLARVGYAIYYGQPRPEVLERAPRTTKRLLDVGCANGAFGMTVKQELGATVWGIEIKEDVARVAAKRLDRVINRDALAALVELPDAFFDCVTFNDVLEHLTDPTAVLREVRKYIAPGGVVIASIPNLRHYQVLYDLVVRGNFDYADAGVLDRTHLRFFTLKSIQKLFVSLGYRLMKTDGINGMHTPRGKWIARLLPPALADMQYMQFICTAQPDDPLADVR
jgi:ubiquinone/menaquinone biosynthesis C-methylase UbiE